ncbi:MAG TPA: IclR family transcriptional regulator [Acidobacteriaceae bacterium]|nr:IclR family transcriptional regulator [Acidobacteriaceae bacterium]
MKRNFGNGILLNVTSTKKGTRAASPARKLGAAKPAEADGKYSVPVVRSTFRILEELAQSEPLGLKEVTRNTGIAKSTVFRILNTLVQMNYVIRDADRYYRISPVLGRLVNEEASSEALRRLALPMMLDLRDEYGETVNLGVQNFDKVTYIEVVPSEFALRLQESRGASVPAHASALGKALLAFSPRSVVEKLIRGHRLERVTPNTITEPDELLAELRRVRAAGFAFDRGEGSALAVCIGAPILNAQGSAIAAMSISGPASRFNPKRDSPAISSLLRATTDLSRALTRRLGQS